MSDNVPSQSKPTRQLLFEPIRTLNQLSVRSTHTHRRIASVVGFQDVFHQLGFERHFDIPIPPPSEPAPSTIIEGPCPIKVAFLVGNDSVRQACAAPVYIDLIGQVYDCQKCGLADVVHFMHFILQTDDFEVVRQWFTERFGNAVLHGDGVPRGHGRTFRGVTLYTQQRLVDYTPPWLE